MLVFDTPRDTETWQQSSYLENSGDLVQTVARAHLDHYSRGWQILLKAETLSEEALEEDKGGPNNV